MITNKSTQLTKTQLLKAYKDGYLDLINKELNRYGNITKDHSFDIEEGYHAGCHRHKTFDYKGLVWKVEMHNGEVRSLGHTC